MILDFRTAEIGVSKVASHLEGVGALAVEQEFATICDIIGNALADEAAAMAAISLRPPEDEIKHAEQTEESLFGQIIFIKRAQIRALLHVELCLAGPASTPWISFELLVTN